MRTKFFLLQLVAAVTAAAAGAAAAAAATNRNPVIFASGYGGSDLYCQFESEASVPVACDGLNLPVGRPFLAIPSPKGLIINSACLKAIFSVPAPPDVKISVADFGGWKGISSPYWTVRDTLISWGYAEGEDFFGSPYDYRFMTRDGLKSSGFTEQMKSLVEQAFSKNSKKVILIAHSNGPPTQYSFLRSMNAEWVRAHVQAVIGLSGNYLGQMNGYGSLLYNSNPDRQAMEATWDATYLSCPWGDYSQIQGVNLVTTNANTAAETNYTTSLTDMTNLFTSYGRPLWSDALQSYWSEMDRSAALGVDTFCYYGSGLATPNSYVFSGGILVAAPVKVNSMDGDDNQDEIDNAFCKVWENDLKAKGYRFDAVEFPGVHHMSMVSDPDVLARVKATLESYVV